MVVDAPEAAVVWSAVAAADPPHVIGVSCKAVAAAGNDVSAADGVKEVNGFELAVGLMLHVGGSCKAAAV